MGTVLSVVLLSLAVLAIAGLNIAAIVYLDKNNESTAKDFIITSIVVAIVSFILALLLVIFLF